MKKVKEFIEAIDKEPSKSHKKIFRVTFEDKFEPECGTYLYPIIGYYHRQDKKVLELDEEDLSYLYNKYKPFYPTELSEIELKEKKEKIDTISRKVKEINKLSSEIDELKKGIE